MGGDRGPQADTGRGKVGRGLKLWGLWDHLTYEMGVTSTGCEVAGEECQVNWCLPQLRLPAASGLIKTGNPSPTGTPDFHPKPPSSQHLISSTLSSLN